MSILSLQQISKSYGRIQALNAVSFEVPKGSVFGILGPNGSGKTTLLGIVTDVLKANSGSFTLFGHPPTAAERRQIGTLLETPNFYHYLSAYDNLSISASIKGRGGHDMERVLKVVGLWERKDSKFKTYSLGMKQRLAIGAALLGNPEVLLLDEPTNGLDPVGIAEVRTLIRDLAKDGKTIIMASHLLDEVERVCTHVAILRKGNLLLSGAVNEVIQRDEIFELGASSNEMLRRALEQHPGFIAFAGSDNADTVQAIFKNEVNPAAINHFCAEKGIWLSHLQSRKKSLETAFLELTNDTRN
ncbi:MAG TPA: ABC transporter ATP-binding protein [Chitinophaga sp.]